jgi:MFS transporter, NHS family, xanthosine permease
MLLSVKNRLITMNFMQFFIWGCWLTTIGAFCKDTKEWSNESFGAIFSTMGFASLFMPTLSGVIADRWISAQKLYGILHLLGGIMLFTLPMASSPTMLFWQLLITMIFYMPTISLSITISYSTLLNKELDLTKEFPKIRVWGTIGFVAALWTISLLGFEKSSFQFYIAGFASFLLGGYAFTLPDCPPFGKEIKKGFFNLLGLNAFALLKQYKLAVFFLFAMLLGASLQLTNAYGTTYIHHFEKIDAYKGLLTVEYPAIIMSISQISEILFILFIPFFLKRFGIKKVMLMSMFAWVLRFGLLGLGDPAGGLWMIVISCVIYGMAFDFFNVSGSMFIETQSDKKIRASVQGLFMMMVNGVGAVLGSLLSGILIDKYFLFPDGSMDWQGIWFSFAGYSLVVAILFAILFKHKHDPNLEVKH